MSAFKNLSGENTGGGLKLFKRDVLALKRKVVRRVKVFKRGESRVQGVLHAVGILFRSAGEGLCKGAECFGCHVRFLLSVMRFALIPQIFTPIKDAHNLVPG